VSIFRLGLSSFKSFPFIPSFFHIFVFPQPPGVPEFKFFFSPFERFNGYRFRAEDFPLSHFFKVFERSSLLSVVFFENSFPSEIVHLLFFFLKFFFEVSFRSIYIFLLVVVSLWTIFFSFPPHSFSFHAPHLRVIFLRPVPWVSCKPPPLFDCLTFSCTSVDFLRSGTFFPAGLIFLLWRLLCFLQRLKISTFPFRFPAPPPVTWLTAFRTLAVSTFPDVPPFFDFSEERLRFGFFLFFFRPNSGLFPPLVLFSRRAPCSLAPRPSPPPLVLVEEDVGFIFLF